MPTACRSCSLRHLLLLFRHPVPVRFRGRAPAERRVRSGLVVERHPGVDHPLRLEAILHSLQANTRRLAQSMIATRYRNPPFTGM